MKKFLVGAIVSSVMLVAMVLPAFAAVNAVTPSTNDINRTKGWAHVDQLSKNLGSTDLQFISTRAFYSCFEYRTDGDTSQKLSENSGNNYNTLVTDGLYPYFCQNNNSRTRTIQANRYVEVRMVFGAETDERFDWTRFDVNPSVFCGTDTSTFNINFANVTNLYGYQFKLHYDQTKVTAVPTFVNSFFSTTSNANIPPTWNASITPGVISFAASKMAPGTPATGSGTVASVTFTGTAPGTVPLTFSDVVLSDKNGTTIPQTLAGATMTICGFASASGTVSLQGRTTPAGIASGDPTGSVTLNDAGFGPYSSPIDPVTGAWSIPSIKVMPTGTSYTFNAAHSLYLGNQLPHTLNLSDAFAAPLTNLLGGDADNNGKVEVADLTCIGGAFGGSPTLCGTTGSNDINWDGTVNILDLSIAGGNYDLATPLSW